MNKIFTRKTVKMDAAGVSVGRLATRIAISLRGKDEAEYLPHLDHGAIVEVANVKEIKLTGKKMEQKVYHHYSGYPSGLKTKKVAEIFANDAADVLKRAVREMLPDNRLRAPMMKRLIIK